LARGEGELQREFGLGQVERGPDPGFCGVEGVAGLGLGSWGR